MHTAWQPVVELYDGMVLGAGSWLDAIARNADLLYGFAHRPEPPFAQSWMEPPGQGAYTAWEGETRYDGAQGTLEFSAWVELPDPVGDAYAKLQLFYNDAWNDLPDNAGIDTSAGAHWFKDDADVDGVVSYDISGFYSPGELVHARLIVNGDGASAVTSAWVYRALLSGDEGFPFWPTWTEWTDTYAMSDGDFNYLRTAAEYLKLCAERPVLAEAVAELWHTQEDAEETLARWSFRKGGQDRIRVQITTTGCDATRYVRVYLQDEQYPHGPSGGTRTTLQTITTDDTTVVAYDMSALDMGERYCIEVASYRQAAAEEPHAVIDSVHVDDLGGETRANVPGTFLFANQPDVADVETLADDLQDMQPVAESGSPLWPEHVFSSYRPFNRHTESLPSLVTTYRISNRAWGILHTYDYLRYHGPAKIVSADGEYSYSLPDSNPTGSTSVFELKSLTWLAKGDWYAVEDTGNLQFAFEDWEA